jgi:hypothetical protein
MARLVSAHLTVTTEADNGVIETHRSDDFVAFWKDADGGIQVGTTHWTEHDLTLVILELRKMVRAESVR